VQNPESFGIAVVDTSGTVVSVEEKPANPRTNSALVGVYGFNQDIYSAVRAISPSKRGELEITDAIQLLIAQGSDVRTFNFAGWWFDTGNLQSWLSCNSAVLEDLNDNVRNGSNFTDSIISKKSVVAPDSTIKNCSIEDGVSIGSNCTLENLTIRNAIVLDNCTLTGPGTIENCAIGANSQISLKENLSIHGSFGDFTNFEVKSK
jgi:glucose-1-phosphate thymidylyltransferase